MDVLDLKVFAKHRSVWMGAAMLWIMIYHTEAVTGFMPFDLFRRIGYAGSDLFFFASGIGVFCSLHKNRQTLPFYRRRFARILPMYWVFLIFWLGFRFFRGQMTLRMALGNVFAIQELYGMDGAFNWYITWQLLFYLLAPLVFLLYEKTGKGIVFPGLALVSFAAGWMLPLDTQWIIGFSRLPVFLLGMWFGRRLIRQERMPRWEITLWIAAAAAGLAVICYTSGDLFRFWGSGMLWYPMCIAAPGVCLVLSLAAEGLKGLGPVSFIGAHTLALYFVHLLVYEAAAFALGDRLQGWVWIPVWGICALGAFLLEKAAGPLTRRLKEQI